MALFGKKQQTTKKETAVAAAPKTASTHKAKKHVNSILISPRITEKSAYLAEGNAYVFNVAKNATKKEIAEAIELIFKVKPVMVRTSAILAKKVLSRMTRNVGKTSSGKKAIVFLKKGDTIEIA